jgi:GGDEF domain-containing protein
MSRTEAELRKKILLVGRHPPCLEGPAEQLTFEGFEVTVCCSPRQIIPQIYADPPDLLIFGDDLSMLEGEEIIRIVRADPMFGPLPVILLLPLGAEDRVHRWAELQVSDFVPHPARPREVSARSRLCLLRSNLELDANPLTHLPGNNTILKEIQWRLDAGQPFAMGYLDIDSFKAFNDRYGFARGDDVLRMTGRIVLNAVAGAPSQSGFVGHVGGDDFVLIVPPEDVERVCPEIIANFDLVAPSFYDEADRRQGFLHLKDRLGRLCQFPIMTLSIAVVPCDGGGFAHVAQIIARATEVKAAAKAKPGSVYLVDRRVAPEPAPSFAIP